MTIGAGTFTPSPNFSFPRSYIVDFYVFRNGNTIVQTVNKFVVTDAFDPNLTATFVLHENFLPWSSNGFTLDFIVQESYYQTTPGGMQIPLPFNIDFYVSPLTRRSGLYLGWLGLKINPEHFDLEPQPPGYWLPPPLP